MKLSPSPRFVSIQEWDDAFLSLWPHRYDYLWAQHPHSGERPDWKTESRHPLSDRLIQQGAYLYGVRFGTTTRYLLLDIDRESLYHPARDPFASRRILAALEPLNLVSWVAVSSSYSGGIHLYLPFGEEQSSWEIAQAAQVLLEQAGIKLTPGHLELFPNPRSYSETPSLYLAHRLPLQAGSYLLNEDFQPIYGTQTTFVHQWNLAESRNTVTRATLERVLKQKQRQRYRISARASKFLNDLNAEIEPGWTGSGQTNYLLGRITLREYIFGHVQRGCEPLSGEALADAICEIARSLPGFHEYCSHQTDLEQRALFYARSIQASHYYPFGSKNQPQPPLVPLNEPTPPSWNQQQSQGARDRIRQAVTDLLNHNALPAQATARRHAIRTYSIGNPTLDKYKELWHPEHLKPNQDNQYHPIEPLDANSNLFKPNQDNQYHPINPNKLVVTSAAPQGQADGRSKVGGSGGISTAYTATMQRWLESGDVILVAEAQRFFQLQMAPDDLPFALTRGQNEDYLGHEEPIMGHGFGVSRPQQFRQSKQSTGKAKDKTGLEEVNCLSKPSDELGDLELEASIQVAFIQYQEEHPQALALAWEAGVYNPLGPKAEDVYKARLLEAEEEDWLHLARGAGWLDVDEVFDAIFYTSPPPGFDLKDADWYLHPMPISRFEVPIRLKDAIVQHPVPLDLIQADITETVHRLGWTSAQFHAFVLDVCGKAAAELEHSDWEWLWFAVESSQMGFK